MRAKDFLTEGGLVPRDFYEKYRFANLINKLANKEPFLTTDGKEVVIPASRAEIADLKAQLKSNFDPADKNPKARAITPLQVPSTIGGVKLSTLQKTKEFGGKVGAAPGA